jgi:acetamidase/formamidase
LAWLRAEEKVKSRIADRMSVALLLTMALSAGGSGARRQQSPSQVHQLQASPQTVVVGYFSAQAKPVLRIASEDIVEVDTLITSEPVGLRQMGLPESEIQPSLINITKRVTDQGPGGHILTGPIFVEGAVPGDALEVRILGVDLAVPYGYQACRADWTFVPSNCQNPRARIIRLDQKKMTAKLGPGIEIHLHPFFGVMGVAPAPEAGRISSNPPGDYGGNIDNKELIAGTKIFLPVRADGALFEVGDGHAAQGDGETGGTALETSLHGRLQFVVRKDMHLKQPRAETSNEFITMGADRDLVKAAKIAVQEMTDFLMEKCALPRTEANRVAGIAADLHIAEVADESVGVYMTVPKSIFVSGCSGNHGLQ